MRLEKFIYSILETPFKSYMVYFITLVLFILSLATFPTQIIKAKMLPSKDSNTFSIYVDLKDGSSINQTKEVTQCISQHLQKNKNITNISAFLGEGQPLDFAALVKQSALKDKESQAEMIVNILKQEDRDITSYNLVSKLRDEVQKNCSSLYDANIKFIELPAGPPVLASIVTEIYGGESFQSRRDFALKIAQILKNQTSLVDIDILADKDFVMYELELDNSKAIMSNVDLEQIKNILFLAFEGMKVSVINQSNAQNQIPIFLRLDDSRLLQNSTADDLKAKLQTLKIINKQGNTVSISEFVKIKEIIKEPTITSKNLNLMINVIAETNKDSQIYPLLNARDEMLNSLSKDYEVTKTNLLNLSFVDKKTKEKFDLVFDGELKVTIDTFIDLGGAFIIALVLIFFLMVMYYKSFAISGGIVLSSFISIIGVIFAHVIMDLITTDTFYLTATSLIGFIGLIGINSRNSTLIIDFSKQLVHEKNLSINEAIAKATATRSKPIILTVLTMVFASALIANDAVFGGLGVALIGGTLISYIVSMFFVPVIIKNQLKKIL
ncbi:RND family efflux system, inner membrane transporter, AcrB family [Arcobacter venerupis]|uniref:RND family efflux system, inner membrane transporter, AcrB family n=1 Tax=Arcobacter venerupis TaxID=1054033 RepID=A0AAE7E4H1_9BACT|nr:efflux RND transporter permease subunit [Arcobacter venerupis]QKF67389.1 RND family efflux system, inner membrane transporter, AcrB family [Arcobacter venerupis]RWS50596.1 multidrug transporter AcrB [Arcobacter venerupis]